MKSILVELQCRTCMYHTYRKSETLLISDFETQAREQLLKDTFFTLRCPRCNTLIEYIHPLAYVDKQHQFTLLIKADKDFKDKDRFLYAEDTKSRKRFISNHTQIPEKMRVLEAYLDDRAIEILKIKLILRFKQKGTPFTYIQFHDMDNDTLWFEIKYEEHMEMLGVRKSDYDKIEQQLPGETNTEFIKIDANWAVEWLKKQNTR